MYTPSSFRPRFLGFISAPACLLTRPALHGGRALSARFAVLLCLLGSVPSAAAQIPSTDLVAAPPRDPLTISLTAGSASVDFAYFVEGENRSAVFNGRALSFGLGPLGATYGTSGRTVVAGNLVTEVTDESIQSGISTSFLEVALRPYVNVPVFKSTRGPAATLHVPIGMMLDFRRVTRDLDLDALGLTDETRSALENTLDDPEPSLLFASAALHAGLGGRVRLFSDVPYLLDNVVLEADGIYGLGGLVTTESEGPTDIVRSLEFSLALKLEQLLARRTGLTLGYTHRRVDWAPTFAETMRGGSASEGSTQHLIRFGLNW